MGLSFETIAESWDRSEAGAVTAAAAAGFAVVLWSEIPMLRWLRIAFVVLLGLLTSIIPEPSYSGTGFQLVMVITVPILLAAWEQCWRLVMRPSMDTGAARIQSA